MYHICLITGVCIPLQIPKNLPVVKHCAFPDGRHVLSIEIPFTNVFEVPHRSLAVHKLELKTTILP